MFRPFNLEYESPLLGFFFFCFVYNFKLSNAFLLLCLRNSLRVPLTSSPGICSELENYFGYQIEQWWDFKGTHPRAQPVHFGYLRKHVLPTPAFLFRALKPAISCWYSAETYLKAVVMPLSKCTNRPTDGGSWSRGSSEWLAGEVRKER